MDNAKLSFLNGSSEWKCKIVVLQHTRDTSLHFAAFRGPECHINFDKSHSTVLWVRKLSQLPIPTPSPGHTLGHQEATCRSMWVGTKEARGRQ
jgi:hypothetical protein